MIDYKQLSDYIIMKCNKDGKEITNKKLQKMMFYCQAYHIAKYRKNLIDNEFEAWVHGAVLPELYNEYSDHGYNAINKFNNQEYNKIREVFGEYLCRFLDKIIDKFSSFTGNQLEKLNHSESPWQEARKGYAPEQICNEIITKDSIYYYYSNLLYKEVESKMEVKKVKKISIKNKELLLAKQRLSNRTFCKITNENKEEYFNMIRENYNDTLEYTWRAMNGK